MHKSFKVNQEKYIKDLDSTAFVFEHIKTGAQVLYLKNTDPNKAFAISFKTIPNDSTGVAHILEHAVLNGSKKYPVKEPFTFLLKSSLATFINAVTYPDRTMYPVASTNEQDLFNLSQVYLDAVFNPLITEEIFMQEGWHYEIFDKNESLKYKGVVFNEMKGAYSTVDAQVENALTQHLYAGSSFALDFGGNPVEIPNLTYANFKKFHADCYNPTNSKSVLYGDLDINKFLNLLDEYFCHFETGAVQNFKPLPQTQAPVDVIEKFAVSEAGEQKPVFVQSWLFDRHLTPTEYFALEVLEYIIVRSDASSVKKALMESNLGESFYDIGYSPYTAYNYFAFGLKGLHQAENAQKVKDLIFSELTTISHGIDKVLLKGALNKIEFLYRTEIGFYNNKGLANFDLTSKFWNYDGDPLEIFNYTQHFANLRKLAEEGYFEEFLVNNFLKNERSVSLTMLPDKDLLATQTQLEERRLQAYKQSLSDLELDELVKLNENFKKLQDASDSEENLTTLPTLKLSDLSKKAREYPISVIQGEYKKTFVKNMEEGVVEIQLFFDLAQVPQETIPYLGFYAEALLKVGTLTKSPEEFTRELDLYFGKINTAIIATKRVDTGEIVKKFMLSFKILQQNQAEAFKLIDEILFEVDFVKLQKLKEIALEVKNSLESEIISSGHTMAITCAQSAFREDALYADATGGIKAYTFYKSLAQDFDKFSSDLLEDLLLIHTLMLYKPGFSANIGTTEENKEYYAGKVDEIYQKLHTKDFKVDQIMLLLQKKRAFIVPAKVNYVAVAFDGSTAGLQPKSLVWLLNTILRLDYLWNEIRVKGGAYGAFSTILDDGVVSMSSYRDPNIDATLSVYAKSGEFLRNLQLSPSQLENYKIGSINRFEPFINSDRLVFATWKNYAQGYTLELRQEHKDAIYNVTQDVLREFGEALNNAQGLPKNIVVIGGKEAISASDFDEVIELF